MESADKAAAVINVSSMLPFTGTALSAHVDGPALPPIQKESVELTTPVDAAVPLAISIPST